MAVRPPAPMSAAVVPRPRAQAPLAALRAVAEPDGDLAPERGQHPEGIEVDEGMHGSATVRRARDGTAPCVLRLRGRSLRRAAWVRRPADALPRRQGVRSRRRLPFAGGQRSGVRLPPSCSGGTRRSSSQAPTVRRRPRRRHARRLWMSGCTRRLRGAGRWGSGVGPRPGCGRAPRSTTGACGSSVSACPRARTGDTSGPSRSARRSARKTSGSARGIRGTYATQLDGSPGVRFPRRALLAFAVDRTTGRRT